MASPIFLVIFSATVYQEVTIVFSFDSLDGKSAVFKYVLCDITILRISLIQIFGKHS